MRIFEFEEFVTMLARVAGAIFFGEWVCVITVSSDGNRAEKSKCVLVSVNDMSTSDHDDARDRGKVYLR